MAEQKDIAPNTASLAYVAQIVMDLYYGDFKGNDDFFEDEHFQFVVRAAYGKLLEADMKEARALAKIEQGFYVIDVSQDWLVTETVSFTKKDDSLWTGKLKQTPFPFAYDRMGYGVQTLIPTGETTCKDFIRISPEERWKYCSLPITSKVFYYVVKDAISLINAKCKPGNVEVTYVPSFTDLTKADDMIISVNKQFDIMSLAVAALRQARDGAVVDETNNMNKNKALATEIDNVYTTLKTKKG